MFRPPTPTGGWEEVATAPNQIAAGMLDRPMLFPYLGSGGIHGVMVPAQHAEEARVILREIWDIGDCDIGSPEDEGDT
jgi:hypothetical protein